MFMSMKMTRFLCFFIFILVLLCGVVQAVGTRPINTTDMVVYFKFLNQSTLGENYKLTNSLVYNYGNRTILATTKNNLSYFKTDGYYHDGAFNFNFSGYINITNSSKLSPYSNNNQTTISLWVKINDSLNGIGSNGRQYIMAKGSANNYEYDLYRTKDTGGQDIIFQLNNLGLTGSTSYTIVDNYVTNKWYYLTIVMNKTHVIPYVNATKGIPAVIARLNIKGKAPLQIGSRSDITTNGKATGKFNGTVSDVIIYNRNLSNKEVWELYYTYIGCLNLTNMKQILGDSVLCKDNYTLNGAGTSTGSGAIIIANNNIIIDGNGSKITGNYNGVGISANGYRNISIRNIVFNNYNRGLFLQNGNSYNIYNNIINHTAAVSILLRGVSNSTVYNNTIYEHGNGIQLDSYSSTISSRNNTVYNNDLFNPAIGIYTIHNTTRNIIKGNNIQNTSTNNQGIYLGSITSNYNQIINNTINNSGWNAIIIISSYNKVLDNIINNPKHNAIDLTGGGAYNSNYNIINNNRITNLFGDITYTVCHALFNKNGTGNNFTSNYIDKCGGGIVSYEGNNNYNNYYYNNTIKNCKYGIYSISNNSYINNTFNNISFNGIVVLNSTKHADYSLFNGITIIKDFVINNSQNHSTTFYNINNISTNTLVYNTNGSVYQIASGTVNITLPPRNESYVLNNYNITEGVTRQYDPITMSGDTTITLASSLHDRVTTDVYINNPCGDIESGDLRSATYHEASQTVTTASYSCNNDVLTFSDLPISGGNNIITLTNYDSYTADCSNLELEFIDSFVTIAELVAILILIGVIAVPIILLYLGQIEFEQLISIGAIVMLLVAFMIAAVAVLVIGNMNKLFC